MQTFMVYETSNTEKSIKTIKDGFNWVAFVFPVPWALFNRMWFLALLLLITSGCMGLLLIKFGGDNVSILSAFTGMGSLIGWIANDYKEYVLINRGYKVGAILLANSAKEAIASYTPSDNIKLMNRRRNCAGGPW